MRGLKVRAWVNEHWVDWLPNSKTLGEYNEVGIYADEYNTESECFIEPCTLLKDKNGKEIYVGDIVRFYYDGKIVGDFEVKYDEEIGWYKGENLVENEYGIKTEETFFLYEHQSVEVIGNIHENAELLNKEEKNEC